MHYENPLTIDELADRLRDKLRDELSSKNLLTVEELADRWRVPKSWVYSKTRIKGENAIPRIQIGKYIRFVPNEVDEWIERQNSE